MKKILMVLGLAATVGFGAERAQAEDGKFAFGPQGGMVFTDYDVENAPAGRVYEDEDGWMAGVFFELGVWTVTLRPEVNYVSKGYTLANQAEVNQKFLEIPVLLKVNPFGDFVFSPFLVLGPSFSHHLESDVTLRGTTVSYDDTVDDWDVAGVAGAGLEFNLSERVGLNVQGRYNFGFRDLDKSGAEVRSRGIYALAGLSLQY